MVVFIRTIILYTVVVVVMRIMGKRQIGELQPFELVIAIMISELAAVPMQDTGIPLLNGIIPILTLMIIEVAISYITLKSRKARKIVCGSPSVLIKDGKILEDQMRIQRFNLSDLMEELRTSGYLNLSDVEFAILETSGKVSIIPKSDSTPVTRKDLNIKQPEELLPLAIIMDGELIEHNLQISGQNMTWLMERLKENGAKGINDVFIAIIDSNGQFYLQRRNGIEK